MATFEHYKLVIPANYYLITFRHTSALIDDEIDCTIGWKDDVGGIEQSDLDDLVSAWETQFIPYFDETLKFVGATARDAGGVVMESLTDVDGGYVGGDPEPYSCAAVIKKLTGVSGRRNRGRFYLPVIGGDNVDPGGNLTTGAQAALTVAAEAFRTTVEADGGTLQLLHSKGWDGNSEPADPGNAPAPVTITALQCAPKMGTQRRRIR